MPRFLRPRGVGVDPNVSAIAVCREHGHEAYVPDEFAAAYDRPNPCQFDTLLCAHVLEHLDEPTGVDLIARTCLTYRARRSGRC